MSTPRHGESPVLWGDLWEGPDQMPSCDQCLDGHHSACLDLIETPPYGLHACGCTNAECAPEE